jgi:hypothetical protein
LPKRTIAPRRFPTGSAKFRLGQVLRPSTMEDDVVRWVTTAADDPPAMVDPPIIPRLDETVPESSARIVATSRSTRTGRPRWRRGIDAIRRGRIRTLIVCVATAGLVTALIAQSDRGAEQESRLRRELHRVEAISRAETHMRRAFGDLGIVILKDAQQVELLRVGGRGADSVFARTPTGDVFGKDFADRLSRCLLNRDHYGYINADDDSDPQIGLRLRRGGDTIDVLFSHSPPGHQDVWVFVTPASGDVFKIDGASLCLNDRDLDRLLREASAP